MKKLLALLLSVSTLFACGATDQQLRDRAAFDMNCAPSKLKIEDIDFETRGVKGCGKRAVYVEHCKQNNYDCTWVLNSSSGEDDE